MSKQTILLIDAHPIWLEGVMSLVKHEADLEICGQTDNLGVATDLVGLLKPDLIILDIARDEGRALEFIRRVSAEHPATAILVLSLNEERLFAERTIRSGAKGYLMKQESGDVLIMAVRQVLRGGVYLSARMRDFLLSRSLGAELEWREPDPGWLSDREIEVFTLLGGGKANKEIARLMNVSVKTVDAYRAHIKQKLRLRSGLELLRLAVLSAQSDAAPRASDREARRWFQSTSGMRNKHQEVEVP
jgi:DNA-binding NarL/FixJ family response regulator